MFHELAHCEGALGHSDSEETLSLMDPEIHLGLAPMGWTNFQRQKLADRIWDALAENIKLRIPERKINAVTGAGFNLLERHPKTGRLMIP